MIPSKDHLTAIHECGHAVAAFELDQMISSISINADEDSWGRASIAAELAGRFVELVDFADEKYPGEMSHTGVTSIMVTLAGALTVDAWVEANGHGRLDWWVQRLEREQP